MFRIGDERRFPDSYGEFQHQRALDHLLEDIERARSVNPSGTRPGVAFPMRLAPWGQRRKHKVAS